MPAPTEQALPLPQSESRDPGILVDVLVLSADLLLFEAIRSAIGERNPVWRARSAEESVDLLLTGRCGVLLVDMAAVSTQPATLIAQIVEQFPDVVVVAAGRREDEALLAQLISDGFVYRFMHKPLTAKRAGMFLQAAIRRHVEQRASRTSQPLLPLAKVLPARVDPRKWLFVAAGVALFVGALVLLASGDRDGAGSADRATTQVVTPVSIPASPQADPILSRARAAFSAGRYEAPAGRNALDLYSAVLLARPGQPEARAGLDATIGRIVSSARLAAADGNSVEARRLLARVQAVAPGSDAVRRLEALLAPPPEPQASAATLALAPPARGTTTAAVAMTPTSAGRPPADRARVPVSASSGNVAANVKPPPPATVSRPVVMPDPLTPRVVNAEEVRLASLAMSRRRGATRSFGAPISSGLPTAGYVTPRRQEPVASPKPATALDPAVAAALAMPADDLDRIYSTEPVYPPAALRDHVEGWVELIFTITETGAVRDIEVIDASPRGVFESAATAALGSWRFKPRLANGQPVARRSTVTLKFNVDG